MTRRHVVSPFTVHEGGRPSLSTPDWLAGLTVPPYLEALPPPQPAPRVLWDHSPAAAPPAAMAAACPPQLVQPGAKTTPASLSSVPRDSGENGDGGNAAVITPAERPTNGDPASSSTGSTTAPHTVEVSGEMCQDQTAVEGQASPEVEKGTPSNLNWRGGSQKIKASQERVVLWNRNTCGIRDVVYVRKKLVYTLFSIVGILNGRHVPRLHAYSTG